MVVLLCTKIHCRRETVLCLGPRKTPGGAPGSLKQGEGYQKMPVTYFITKIATKATVQAATVMSFLVNLPETAVMTV